MTTTRIQKVTHLLIDDDVFTACYIEGERLKLQTLVKINNPKRPIRIIRTEDPNIWAKARSLLLT